MEGWKKLKFSDVVSYTKKPRDLEFKFPIPFIPMELIPFDRDEVLSYKLVRKISSGTYVENGDVLLAKITPSFENGKQGVLNIGYKFAYATTEVIPFKGRPIISETRYLAYYLKKGEIRAELAGKMEGSTGRQRLSKSALDNLIIPLPPLPEQRKIAYILSTVQKAIEKQDQLIKTTTELKKAMMQKLFTEGLHGEPQKETEIGLVPESWEVLELGEVVLKSKGGGTPSTKKREYWNGNIFWTTSKWLESEKIFLYDGEKKITKVGLENSSTNLLPTNNLLVSTRVVIGKVAINKIPIAYSQDLTGLWIDKNLYNLEFLAYQFLFERIHNYLQSLKRGATIQGITREDLLKSLFVVPRLEEQKKIGNVLQNFDKKTEYHQNKKVVLQDLFKTLLHELMTGQRRVYELEFEGMVKKYELKEQRLSMAAESD